MEHSSVRIQEEGGGFLSLNWDKRREGYRMIQWNLELGRLDLREAHVG